MSNQEVLFEEGPTQEFAGTTLQIGGDKSTTDTSQNHTTEHDVWRSNGKSRNVVCISYLNQPFTTHS